ncbi:MAG: hypothetical protein E6G91_19490 [Alphaproteobacteria bacterium]|jgi:hypothetical protein|nr:MAG: hypothetical protein E6G91_19490 [Alphaproteobacteria bacterium]
MLEGQFLTPAFKGRRLELNPFAVFLAIAFCTWLRGPVALSLPYPSDVPDRGIWSCLFAGKSRPPGMKVPTSWNESTDLPE